MSSCDDGDRLTNVDEDGAREAGVDALSDATQDKPITDGGVTAEADLDADALAPLVIHTRANFVFLGDGSTHLVAVDGGTVVFADPTLAAPQMITEVHLVPRPDDAGTYTFASTVVDVGARDVWMPSMQYQFQASGVIVGRVLQDDAGVAGARITTSSAYNFSRDGGLFSIAYDTRSTPLPVSVCASVDAGLVGAVTGLMADAGSVIPADIVLDHGFGETVTVSTTDPQNTAVADPRIVDFAPGAGQVCSVSAPPGPSGNGPFTLAAVTKTPPFDTFVRYVHLDANDRVTFWPVPNGVTSVTVPLPALPTITAPAVVPPNNPLPATSNPLTFTWTNIGPDTSFVALWVGEEGDAWGTLNWIAYMPPSKTSFTFFALPAGIAPVQTFPTNIEMFANVTARTLLPPALPRGPLFSAGTLYDLQQMQPGRKANTHGRFKIQ